MFNVSKSFRKEDFAASFFRMARNRSGRVNFDEFVREFATAEILKRIKQEEDEIVNGPNVENNNKA